MSEHPFAVDDAVRFTKSPTGKVWHVGLVRSDGDHHWCELNLVESGELVSVRRRVNAERLTKVEEEQ